MLIIYLIIMLFSLSRPLLAQDSDEMTRILEDAGRNELSRIFLCYGHALDESMISIYESSDRISNSEGEKRDQFRVFYTLMQGGYAGITDNVIGFCNDNLANSSKLDNKIFKGVSGIAALRFYRVVMEMDKKLLVNCKSDGLELIDHAKKELACQYASKNIENRRVLVDRLASEIGE